MLSNDASFFVRVADAAPDVVQELRYATCDNFTGRPVPGYDSPDALLLREAADALRQVSEDLKPRGLGLKLFDAYRPQRATDAFIEWSGDPEDTLMKPRYYPDVNKADMVSQGYLGRRSRHSRGSAVDVTLIDLAAGSELDMGSTFDFFGDISHTESPLATPLQHANRMLLREVMIRRGFAPISTEWWHFSLIDEPFPETWFTFTLAEGAACIAGPRAH